MQLTEMQSDLLMTAVIEELRNSVIMYVCNYESNWRLWPKIVKGSSNMKMVN